MENLNLYRFKDDPTYTERSKATLYGTLALLTRMFDNLLILIHDPLIVFPVTANFVLRAASLFFRQPVFLVCLPITIRKYYIYLKDPSLSEIRLPPYIDFEIKAPYYFLNLRLRPDPNVVRAVYLATEYGLIDPKTKEPCYLRWLEYKDTGDRYISEEDYKILRDYLFQEDSSSISY